ncbi:ABC transporter ATP-binding protein [bacterium]|nr:MAG: ABC transporter ATP-binding protein [bacterium]
MSILSLENISKSFSTGIQRKDILRTVSFDFWQDHTYALMGKSGSGKSTLLQILCGLLKPDFGSVKLDGQEINQYVQGTFERFLNEKIGLIFQQPYFIPELNVLENIMVPLFVKTGDKAQATEKAVDLLELVELSDYNNTPIKALSGGQQQRAGIARALCNQPLFLLADEPTSGLDQAAAAHVTEILKKAHTEYNVGIILSTHMHDIASQMDYQIELYQGIVRFK